ncbi:MAG: hypothetical protein KBD44_00810 [Candidatus Pacebacteria bacterium]|jgi:cation transporter-like permease|nr:hypothetical protein [Candidatus Paceibacterota bacterium]
MIYAVTIIFGVTFAVLHTLAEAFSLYWLYDWLDMPMHILGGIVLMFMYASLRQMSLFLKRLPVYASGIGFAGALIAWEIFGILRYGGLKPDFWSDTLADLVCGITGIVTGYMLVRTMTEFMRLTRPKDEHR